MYNLTLSLQIAKNYDNLYLYKRLHKMKKTQRYILTALLALIFCIGGFLLLTFSNNTYDNLGYTQEYINYLKLSDEEKKTLSIIPDKYPVKLNDFDKNYMSKLNSYTQNVELPTYFNLQEEITVYTDNQGNLGLCWAYASAKSLETFLALNYGEYWNFSEGYVSYVTAKNSNYEIGNGGNWIGFVNSISKLGVLSETYLPYDDVYGLKNNNIQYYEYLEENADCTYDKLVESVNVESSNNNNFSVVKTHIKQNGSLYINIWSNKISTGLNGYKVMNTASYGANHAVSIIGWDDNFSKLNFPSEIRPSVDGAFIALNSWGSNFGDEGVFYISYEDVHVNNKILYGFVKAEDCEEDTLIFEDTINNSSTYNKTENMKNMFNLGDEISLNFVLKNTLNTPPNVGIKIKKNNIDITKSFDITNTSIIQSTNISLYHNNELDAGTYIIEFTYNNEKYVKSFYVVSGAEINGLVVNFGHTKMNNSINGQTKSVTTNPLTKSVGGTIVKYANISIFVNTIYCDITQINLDNEFVFNNNLQINASFSCTNFDLTKQIYDINIITSSGYTETYKIIFLDGEDTENYNINYNLNGGTNSNLNPKKFNVNAGIYSLYEPTRQNYDFAGWFINEITLTSQITQLNDVYLGNILLVAQWAAKFETNVFLSAEYKDFDGKIVSSVALTYGMIATFSADFSFLNEDNLTIKWYINTIYQNSYDSQNSIEINIAPGIFYISCEATKNDDLLSVQTTDYRASKRELFLSWGNSDLVYNGENNQPDVELLGLINDDIYPLNFHYTRFGIDTTNSTAIGEYEIAVTNLSNTNYIIKQNYQLYFNILPVSITIKANNVTAKYSDELLSVSNCWTCEGVIYNNDIIVEVTTNATPHEAGTYDIFLSTNMNINYNITLENGTYTISNGNIFTYKLPDGNNAKIYVNEGQQEPDVNDIYSAKLFSILSVRTLSSENGDIIYEVKEISLMPIVVVLLAIFGVMGIAISSCLIRKNKWQKYS